MIERIDIRLLESIGLEQRGNFYDPIGTLRDVGQNHLLAMLAAITMEYPQSPEATVIGKNRANILETLKNRGRTRKYKNTFRAQYHGYKDIKGARPNSETETYFALKPNSSILAGKEFRYLWKRGSAWRRCGKK